MLGLTPTCMTALTDQGAGLHCVFHDNCFIYFNSKSWLGRHRDKPFHQREGTLGESVPPGVFRLVEFQHRSVGGESPVRVGE